MILGLLFSKDRAMQVDACLASFFRHVEDEVSANMFVVYNASSQRFLRQYEELACRYRGKALFVLEQGFRSNVLQIIRSVGTSDTSDNVSFGFDTLRRFFQPRMIPTETQGDAVLFLVDDTLFVRPIELAAAQTALWMHGDALGFSLRLGRNTKRCYVLDRRQELPRFENAGERTLKYDWRHADGDFGYPFEISSSLYRLPIMSRLVSRLSFTDPNTLESQLALCSKRFMRSMPFMLCPENSVAFSAPVNRVQDVYENRSGANPEWSIRRLADRFDEGLRIDIAALDGFIPSSCHQEVELSFEPGC